MYTVHILYIMYNTVHTYVYHWKDVSKQLYISTYFTNSNQCHLTNLFLFGVLKHKATYETYSGIRSLNNHNPIATLKIYFICSQKVLTETVTVLYHLNRNTRNLQKLVKPHARWTRVGLTSTFMNMKLDLWANKRYYSSYKLDGFTKGFPVRMSVDTTIPPFFEYNFLSLLFKYPYSVTCRWPNPFTIKLCMYTFSSPYCE